MSTFSMKIRNNGKIITRGGLMIMKGSRLSHLKITSKDRKIKVVLL